MTATRTQKAPAAKRPVSVDLLAYACVACAAVPVFIGYVPWGAMRSVDLPGACLAAIAVMATVGAGVVGASTARSLAASLWVRILALIGITGLVATVVAPLPLTSLFGGPETAAGLLMFAAAGLALCGASVLFDRLRDVLAGTVAVLGGVQVLMASSQAARGVHPQGTLENSTYMAQVVLMALPLAIALLVGRAGPRFSRFVPGVLAFTVAGFFVFTESRTAAVIALAYGLWSIMPEAWRAARPALTRWAVLGGIAAVSASGTAAALAVRGVIPVPGVVFGATPRLWALGARAGFVGPDGYRFAIARIAGPEFHAVQPGWPGGPAQMAGDSHNLLIGWYSAAWWPGVVLGLVFSAVIVHAWITAGDSRRSPFAAGALLYAATLLTAPAPLQTLPLAILILGASLPLMTPAEKDASSPAWSRFMGGSMGAVAVAAMMATMLFLGTTGSRLSVVAEGPSVTEAEAAHASAVAGFWRFDPLAHAIAARRWAWVAASGVAGARAREVAEWEAVLALEPENPIYRSEYVSASVLSGREGADGEIAAALDLYPSSPELNGVAAVVAGRKGDVTGMRRRIETLLAAEPEEPRTYDLAAQAYSAVGDTQSERAMRETQARLEQARQVESLE